MRKTLSRCSMLVLILVLAGVLAGCAPAAPQADVYPGAEWAWTSSPESLGWSSDKLAVGSNCCHDPYSCVLERIP